MVVQTHSLINRPEDDVKIWRYLSIEKFLSLIVNSGLYFSRLDQFEDQWEGSWPKALIDFPAFKSKEVLNQIKMLISAYNKTLFVNCWCMSEYESNLM